MSNNKNILFCLAPIPTLDGASLYISVLTKDGHKLIENNHIVCNRCLQPESEHELYVNDGLCHYCACSCDGDDNA